MFDAKNRFRSLFVLDPLVLGAKLLLLIGIFALWPVRIYATTRNVTDTQYAGGAKGDGTTDDTAAINSAIAALQPGDTLLFPCTGSNTYLISSQLTISVTDVTVNGSSCAIIKDTYNGTSQGMIMLIGGSGTSIIATYGTAVALSAVANELSTSFTTITSLGVNPGDYVYLCQGGTDGSATPGASCPPSGTNGICDPSGCRGEILKVASVSGNTVTVTTALHDTYDPVANSAVAQKMQNPLTGITVKNITFDGTASTGSNNVYGLVLAGVAYSTVSGVTAKNVKGAAIVGGGDFSVTWTNITVTAAGSEDCGGAAHFLQQGNLSVNTLSVSQENQQRSGSGACFLNAGAFGFELITSANGTISNVSVDASGAWGRPFKTTAARWNTLNSVTVQNGSNINDNGITIEYFSSHNTYNDCFVTNNGTGTGTAGINLFGNYNQYNVFSNCTVTGNANSQFVDSDFDRLQLGTDSNNAIVGGTYGAAPSAGISVIILEAPYDSVSGATISGPAASGYSGIEMDGPNGAAPCAAHACINNNVFVPGSPPLTYAITSYFQNGGDIGSGNQLGGLNNNPNGYFTAGTCTAP
jgi:pectate lyase-like protein